MKKAPLCNICRRALILDPLFHGFIPSNETFRQLRHVHTDLQHRQSRFTPYDGIVQKSGNTMLVQIGGFLFCAVVIFFAGQRLSYYGDKLADLTGMGRAWIGLVFMAAVTSLPELMVGINSSAVLQSADLAVGDILGSCAFNLGILSFMDVFTPKHTPLFSRVSRGQILAAAFGVILVTLVGLILFLNKDISLLPSLGMTSVVFAVIYFWSMKTLHSYQNENPAPQEAAPENGHVLSLRRVLAGYFFFAALIVVAASALPRFADYIAINAGLSKTFVGTLFLAISTSLPEIAVSFASVRIGATDIAVGNLLGSNIFNIFILFVDDVFYTKGLLLQDASKANLVSVFFVLLMTAMAIIGFVFPSRRKRILLAGDTFVIFALYVINVVVLYKFS